jgi:A/G-specific adenine glycosylase
MDYMQLTKQEINSFQAFIWDFYKNFGRSFVWRNIECPYKVLISEIMLQQTQTYRVEPKFEQFIVVFPTVEVLAQATLKEVLSIWQGLGYNRRALYLHKTAQKIMQEYQGQLPADSCILETFPGIGKATANSICAFAFNIPTIFIETNIRAVFIHTFFRDKKRVSDTSILPLVKAAIDKENPREWYYALMDYGVYLKKNYSNPSRKSRHHIIQSKFEGSDRQIRGAIIRLLTMHKEMREVEIVKELKKESNRVIGILQQLCKENLIEQKNDYFFIL